MSRFKIFVALLLLNASATAAERNPDPLRFEPNVGQTSHAASFMSRSEGAVVFLQPTGVTARAGDRVWTMELIGANSAVAPTGLEPTGARSHYLAGPANQWHRDVPSYGRVECRDIYPGVDLVYSGDRGLLRYEFRLGPGADPERIVLRFGGTHPVRFEPDGDVVAGTGRREIRHANLGAYEIRNGVRTNLAGRFVAAGPDEVALSVPHHDRLASLVMTYSTYLGGSGQDSGTSVAVDAAGNAYVAGYTESTDFPATAGAHLGSPRGVDAYVAKLSPTGALLYIAYVGGSGDDRAFGIAVDSAGSAVIAGWTTSNDFPVSNASQAMPGGGRDGFVAKLNPAGSGLVFSTYLGGAGSESANGVAVDTQGCVYVAGETTSVNFPVLNSLQSRPGGATDAFVAKYSGMGVRIYSTLLGGMGDDRATAIAVDGPGYAYITGSTYSPNLPVLNAFQPRLQGGQDVFAAKIALSGSTLMYCTYLGGSGGTVSGPETGSGIAVDSGGYVYIAGSTSSANFPTVGAFQPSLFGTEDAFVAKLSAGGSALVYSTYLGGSSVDMATAIAVDVSGRVYVAGYTASTDFPVKEGIQSSNRGGYDGFVARLNAVGSGIELATYLGGLDSDSIYGVGVDSGGNVYVTGQTLSTNFPTNAAIQLFKAGMAAFVGGIAASLSTPVMPTDGLISYWSADGSGIDTISSYNATLINGAAFVPGKVGQSFSFDGVSSYAQVSGAGTISGARTLSMWVYPHNTGRGNSIFTAGAAGAADFFVVNGNQLFIDHWGTPAYRSSLLVRPETWNHIAVTYDGSVIQFYVNGVAAQPVNGVLYNYGIGAMEIGGNTIGGSSAGLSFNGMIDEARLYARALSASEIQSLYGSSPSAAIAYWSADGNTDDGISGYNGELKSGASFTTGKVNQAFNLNGVDSYVQATGTGSVTGPRTVSAWIFPHGGGSGNPILTSGIAGAADFFVVNGNRILIDHWGTPTYYSSLMVVPETWNHVAVTYDGSVVQFYINGAAAQSVNGALYNFDIGTLQIGGNTIGGTSAGRSFNGMIDEVRLYSRALSAAEVHALYAGSDSGLVAYWSGDSSAVDTVSGYNGTLMNGASIGVGKVNQAFRFDGIASYVQVSGSGMISGPRTLTAWVYPHANGRGNPIVSAGIAGAADFLVIQGDRLFIDHWGTPAYYSSITVNPETWNHIAVIFDGSVVQFYVNGVPAEPVAGALYIYSVGTLEIGGNAIGGSSAGAAFDGLIDEVRLYSRALTGGEIQTLFNSY